MASWAKDSLSKGVWVREPPPPPARLRMAELRTAREAVGGLGLLALEAQRGSGRLKMRELQSGGHVVDARLSGIC